MKYLAIIGLAAALAASVAPSLAQTPSGTPNPAMRQQFRQMHAQFEAIRTTERSQMLNALTPSHRSLLASIAGQLATSVNPDFHGAANRLDAALSSGEKQTILTAAQVARSSERTLMQNMHVQMHGMGMGMGMSPHPHPTGMGMGMGSGSTTSAGAVLLRVALTAPEFGMHHMR